MVILTQYILSVREHLLLHMAETYVVQYTEIILILQQIKKRGFFAIKLPFQLV